MKLEKVLKKLTASVVEEMYKMQPRELERAIADAERAMAAAVKERDDNPQYQAAKLAVRDLSEGLREVRSYQAAKIQYALYRLDGEGVE